MTFKPVVIKSFWRYLVSGAALCLLPWGTTAGEQGQETAAKQRQAGPIWEYKVVLSDMFTPGEPGLGKVPQKLTETYNKLGAEGWECVGVLFQGNERSLILFKRQKAPRRAEGTQNP